MGSHTPTVQQRRLVERWEGSALSKAAFARRHGVHPGTFSSWVARHRSVKPSSPPEFVRVDVVPEPVPAPMPSFIVRFDEHQLGFDGPPPPAWFAAVLRELAPC